MKRGGFKKIGLFLLKRLAVLLQVSAPPSLDWPPTISRSPSCRIPAERRPWATPLRRSLNAVKVLATVHSQPPEIMTVAERRERNRELLRVRIVEAARDLLSEQGLAALSMRAIAERVEYSPATLYLYFQDKDEILRDVVHAGFERMGEVVAQELALLSADAGAARQYAAMGRAYARFALENTAYFRVMFELPGVARCEGPAECAGGADHGLAAAAATISRGVESGEFGSLDPWRAALVGWGLIHGLTSLYLGGHLGSQVDGPAAFNQMVEEAMTAMYEGWRPEEAE